MLGVLTGGTLLTSQMQAELSGNVDKRIAETQFERPDESPPLKLNEFKLPKDTPIQIPKGAKISPDLSKLELPKDLDLEIPDDLDLSGLDFELPEDFDLQLPAGTIFSPPGLDLPNGGSLMLPDGSELRLPAGSKLDLPPEVVDRLLQQGLPVGVLAAAAALSLTDLPPDLLASLDPPQFNGRGRLALPAGSTITLPDGQRLPFPAGELPADTRFTLPAGSTFDIPVPNGTGRMDLPVPRPISPSQLEKPATPKPASKIPVSTEITGMPSRVRKGEPVTVSGYVRESNTGRPVAGAPVDIFMNESKRLPGVHVGSGISDSSGTFRISITLPTDKPARDYQLVNHASAFRDASGREYADGWGDPPFTTYASTTLRFNVPARDGLGTTTTMGGTLTDHTGAPVPGVPVTVTVGNTTIGRPTTDAAGRFSAQHRFTAGTHVVDARFAGNSNYEASSARGFITINDFAIELTTPTHYGKPGDSFLLSGRTLGRGAVAPERAVAISSPFMSAPVVVVSDSAGRFTHTLTIPREQAPGSYTITYDLREFNVTKTQTVVLNLTGTFAITMPALWDVERPVPATVALRASDGRALPDQPIRLSFTGPGGTRDIQRVTDASGLVVLDVTPLRTMPGDYALTASLAPDPHFTVPSVSRNIRLGLFEVAWEVPDTVVRMQKASASLTATFNGAPYAGQSLTVDAFGLREVITDARGRATIEFKASADTPLGRAALTAEAADHPGRSASTKVIALPKLAIEAPEEFTSGEPITPTVTLTDDVGKPLRDAALTLVVNAPEGIQRTTVRTDANGKWSGPLNVTNGVGNVTLAARYDAADTHLPAESVRAMSATAPIDARAPFDLPAWALPVAVGTILAGATGAGAAWYIRKRPATRRVPIAAAAAPVVHAIDTDFAVTFGIPADEPAVWGVGDPLDLAIENRGPQGEFELSWNGGSVNVYLPGGARQSTTLTFPTEGEVTITGRRAGLPGMTPATARVTIVDYRKETAREFDLFLDAARAIEPSITRQSTPREIGWLLGSRLPPEAEAPLDELASLMEVTNYSHYAVAREHYLRFVRATRTLTPILTPTPPGPPPPAAEPGG